ncbi:efflux RND transporter periplasmic adaptor subunit [Spirulina sp. 06S082]|uniref:efflux RND transporter periplasmic adaptor subunit n=1 Tax=Spirulina sp. 06S082 TaxID=3110248 RepID=UPI002B1EF558|nr:efflux RND transporter periplasmic adaptor subunit [Spirulina sp. 06S082]MEA5471051.1 efflux RND transporter periplasmic adaptor subunit [Spirulina sp. 06S082]
MKLESRWKIPLVAIFILAIAGVPIYLLLRSGFFGTPVEESSANSVSVLEQEEVISALGRISPKDEIITVSGSSAFPNARVARLFVKEGDRIRRGQTIAILENITQLQATVEQAKIDAKLVQARLDRVQTGDVKQGQLAAQEARIANLEAQFRGEVAIQQAQIDSLEAEINSARNDFETLVPLAEEGAISQEYLNKSRLQLEALTEQRGAAKAVLNKINATFPNQILEAQATLDQLREVRPVDVRIARTELESAIAAVSRAEADLALAYIRSPLDAQVLRINTFAGESIKNGGIVELAQTQQMYAIAEVYETDIGKIRPGQKAIITSSIFPRELSGIVEAIGSQIGKRNVLSNDPTLDIDVRIIEVKIRLKPEDSQQVSHFINSQVEVKIYITE